MSKLLNVFVMLLLVICSISCDPAPSTSSGSDDSSNTTDNAVSVDCFTIKFTNVELNGSPVTGDIQIFSNITDSSWGTHPIFAVTAGVGTYTNSSIAQINSTKYQIAALFVTSNASAAWGDASMVDNSRGSSNWDIQYTGYRYDWDLSMNVGPVATGWRSED